MTEEEISALKNENLALRKTVRMICGLAALIVKSGGELAVISNRELITLRDLARAHGGKEPTP